MSTIEATHSESELGTLLAAKAGDQSAFSQLVERHQPELRLHCYRMLGSLDDSEDAVQETFVRAWRKRATLRGPSFRAWVYRIATNACLDALERRPRRLQTARGPDVPWLQPYPDRLLEGIATDEAEPDAAVVEKETIELAFLVAIQHLPPRQRAVLILRDVLGWSARETASLLTASDASVNSALQRARATLRKHLPARRLEWTPGSNPSEQERALLRRYVDATEQVDADVFIQIMREDARFSMPPEPGLHVGREAIVAGWKKGGFGSEEFRDFCCVLARANMQPAVAGYLRRQGDTEYRPLAIDVLRIEEGAVAEIIAFPGSVFPAFDLPPAL